MKAKYIRDNGIDDLTQNNIYPVTATENGCLEIIDDTGIKCWFVSEKFEIVDTVVESVVHKYKSRSKVGIDKYGTTLDRDDLSVLEWLNHFQEEMLDGVLYIEKAMQEIRKQQ